MLKLLAVMIPGATFGALALFASNPVLSGSCTVLFLLLILAMGLVILRSPRLQRPAKLTLLAWNVPMLVILLVRLVFVIRRL